MPACHQADTHNKDPTSKGKGKIPVFDTIFQNRKIDGTDKAGQGLFNPVPNPLMGIQNIFFQPGKPGKTEAKHQGFLVF